MGAFTKFWDFLQSKKYTPTTPKIKKIDLCKSLNHFNRTITKFRDLSGDYTYYVVRVFAQQYYDRHAKPYRAQGEGNPSL